MNEEKVEIPRIDFTDLLYFAKFIAGRPTFWEDCLPRNLLLVLTNYLINLKIRKVVSLASIQQRTNLHHLRTFGLSGFQVQKCLLTNSKAGTSEWLENASNTKVTERQTTKKNVKSSGHSLSRWNSIIEWYFLGKTQRSELFYKNRVGLY